MQFNDRSRFIDDIPARLIEDVSERRGGFATSRQDGWQSGQWRQPAWSKGSSFAQKPETASAWKPRPQSGVAQPQGQRQSFAAWSRGSGMGMNNAERVGGTTVAGVQRGMNPTAQVVPSAAREAEKPSLFAAGDHVMHRKFGRGAVVRVSGSGADARIMIRFDDTRVGVKEFALSIAPIIKTEG